MNKHCLDVVRNPRTNGRQSECDCFRRWTKLNWTPGVLCKKKSAVVTPKPIPILAPPKEVRIPVSAISPSKVRYSLPPVQLKLNKEMIWSEWRLTVIAATVRIALVDILDLSEVDIPAGVFLHPAVGWG